MNVERSLIHAHSHLRKLITQTGTERLEGQGPLRYTLAEVLARLPDIAEVYSVTFDRGACYPTYVQTFQEIQRDVYVMPSGGKIPQPDELRKAFNLDEVVDIQEHSGQFPVGEVPGLRFYFHRENSPPPEQDFEYVPIKNDSRGISHIVEPLPHGLRLSSLSLMFMASFALGMIVRYYPSRWSALAGTGTGDSMRPLVAAAARVIEMRFPEFVLDEIEQSHPGAVMFHHHSMY